MISNTEVRNDTRNNYRLFLNTLVQPITLAECMYVSKYGSPPQITVARDHARSTFRLTLPVSARLAYAHPFKVGLTVLGKSELSKEELRTGVPAKPISQKLILTTQHRLLCRSLKISNRTWTSVHTTTLSWRGPAKIIITSFIRGRNGTLVLEFEI